MKNHLYYIHYKGHNGKDMLEIRTSPLSIEELTAKWLQWYEFAIKNHGYQLQKIEEEKFA